MGMCDFSLPGIGERHENDDGSSRQEELARCRPGEPVRLVREPENPHDHMAVAVISCRGVRVAYLKRDRAVWIGSKIDRGYDVRAIVERVKGVNLEGATLGIVLRVNLEGEDPELPEPPVRIPHSFKPGAKNNSMVSNVVSGGSLRIL